MERDEAHPIADLTPPAIGRPKTLTCTPQELPGQKTAAELPPALAREPRVRGDSKKEKLSKQNTPGGRKAARRWSGEVAGKQGSRACESGKEMIHYRKRTRVSRDLDGGALGLPTKSSEWPKLFSPSQLQRSLCLLVLGNVPGSA